ncbi:hypothetical protein HanRHA438_Chr17g0806051 [Helianthus annuus]|nr:hypothetical protein HanRHA438_Chr17g0806051 [Helianthus annuus]
MKSKGIEKIKDDQIRVMMPEELSKMTSLSQLEKFQAIEKIKDDQIRVMTFWSLGEEEREAWIRFLLSS